MTISFPICNTFSKTRLTSFSIAPPWFIKTDISSLDSVKAAFAKIKEKYGSIDALYNNASVFLARKDTSIDKLEEDVWDKVLSINLNGLYYCSKQAVNLMKDNGGSIVNTASSAGVVGIP